jgi:acyl-coenzyme A thioesterase PaaI-like protein
LLTLESDPEKQIVLPYAFAAIDFHRAGTAGESFRLQARRRSREKTGVVWDAVVFAADGQPVISAQGLEMRWLSL